jgi:hypothetical protein
MINPNLPEKCSNFVLFNTTDGKVNIENELRKKVVCANFALTTAQKEFKGMAHV